MRNWKDKISKYISYTEATKSMTAVRCNIDNYPNEEQLSSMRLIAKKVFEPLRSHFGVPLGISSFFRSKTLNKKIGGSTSSQHCKGEAMDIDADIYGMVTNRQLFNFIKDNLEFDQLIWEFGTERDPAWVHVSYKTENNRKQILVAYKEKNVIGRLVTKYKKYKK